MILLSKIKGFCFDVDQMYIYLGTEEFDQVNAVFEAEEKIISFQRTCISCRNEAMKGSSWLFFYSYLS